MKRTLVAAAALLLPCLLKGQPADYYRCPVDIPVLFSANYGEIRTNRFHTGVDVKTQGKVGIPLHAAADGYVSRVTVAPWGYGRALYIAHPNGTTTVYAHMHRFTGEIEDYLRRERYKAHRSDIDLFPDPSMFPVKKGDPIGLAGNSGSSSGPHLHYEVRRSSDSRTLNAAANGWITAKDDIKPTIVRLYRIDVDTLSGVPVHSAPKAYEIKKGADGNYTLSPGVAVKAGPTSYLVVEATDRKNDVGNTFGVYRIRMSVDGVEALEFVKDELLFNDNRYCCASVLYSVQRKTRNEAVMLAVREGNELPMYKKAVGRGALRIAPGEKREVAITVEDDARNSVSLSFTVEGDASHTPPECPAGRAAYPKRDFIHSGGGMTVMIPRGALYEPIFYDHAAVDTTVKPRPDSIRPLSPVYRVGDGAMPLHKSMVAGIEAPVPEELRRGACIARVADNGTLSYLGGSWNDGAVKVSTRDFGTFCVVSDTIPPVIRSSFADGADLSKTRTVTFTATDNFSGIADFTASIDGQWVIFERDASAGKFHHTFDMSLLEPGRSHTFEMRVRDGAGNAATWTGTFHK